MTAFRVLGVIALLAALVACGSGSPDQGGPQEPESPSDYVTEFGGQEQVYERILTGTDCDVLQEEFDIAADNNERAEPGSAEARWTLGYMTAADKRMEAAGCYD